MKPISIQLYTVRTVIEKEGPLPVLKRIADIGYKAVEGSGMGFTNPEFRKIVEDLGMVVSSCWGGVPTPETVQQFIDEAGALGAKHTVVGLWIDDFKDLDAIKATAEKFNAVIPAIHNAGLTFSMHNHWIEFEPRGDKLAVDHLVEFSPDLALELDIYWCTNFGANDPVQMVSRHRDRVHLMHVKDGPITKGEPMTAVGSGKIDVPGCLAAANPEKLEWLIVELDEYAGDMMVAVEDSYRYLVGNGLASGNKAVS
jgi:sugar phosphate isomerase/epimerase